MQHALLVMIGGAAGALARFLLSGLITLQAGDLRFPLGTFIVNIVGCFAIGLLAGLSLKHHFFSPEIYLLFATGFLGGFTTFSAFGLESLLLFQRGEALTAAIYITASVVVGLLFVWLGYRLIPTGV